MKLEVVIPSRGRIEKLTKCLNSILLASRDLKDIKIKIYLDKDEEILHFKNLLGDLPEIELFLLQNYRVPDFWNQRFKESKSDILIYLNDDIELFDDCLIQIINYFEVNFPDLDGVVGINQININSPDKVQAAFGAVGIKYSERFPERQVFCPDYNRFYGDYELWRFAKEVNKFVFGERALLNHYHPCTNRKLEDDTHVQVRKFLPNDKEIFRKRQELNLLWGRDFKLINTEI